MFFLCAYDGEFITKPVGGRYSGELPLLMATLMLVEQMTLALSIIIIMLPLKTTIRGL